MKTENYVIGRVAEVTATCDFTGRQGKTVKRRDLTVEICGIDDRGKPVDVEEENVVTFCFFGSACRELDLLRRGQAVKVCFELRGRRVKDEEGKEARVTNYVRPRRVMCFNTLVSRWK